MKSQNFETYSMTCWPRSKGWETLVFTTVFQNRKSIWYEEKIFPQESLCRNHSQKLTTCKYNPTNHEQKKFLAKKLRRFHIESKFIINCNKQHWMKLHQIMILSFILWLEIWYQNYHKTLWISVIRSSLEISWIMIAFN